MRSTETKTQTLRKILEALDWNEDLQELENGPITAQAIRDFDTECGSPAWKRRVWTWGIGCGSGRSPTWWPWGGEGGGLRVLARK